MKLLVFAHTPPPYHGQSYMVEMMLAGLGGDQRKRRRSAVPGAGGPAPAAGPALGIECYHVNARLSKKLEDIGDFRVGKFVQLLGYCLQAVWCRFRYRVTTLYYIPAPGQRSALYRDWVVMLLCRPFFKRVILHWHAAGLAKWLETVVQIRSRGMTYRLMKRVDLSIVLSNYNRADAEKLFARHIKVVNNGVPDPCPEFATQVLPRRKARLAARQKLLAGGTLTPEDLVNTGSDPHLFRVLYLAHCTREKGLFDALDAVARANARLGAASSPIRLCLSVAGEFMNAAEQKEFEQRIASADLELPAAFAPSGATDTAQTRQASARSGVSYHGFVFGEKKKRLLAESDCFCFPTYYYAESFGLVVIEAMAFGSAIVATRWRSIPEILPPNHCGLVDIRQPRQVTDALLGQLTQDTGEELRALYLRSFSMEQHLAALAEAFRSTEQPPPNLMPELSTSPSTG
jgi:glycosyltransferase involved in cell wall biosynthesis